MLSSRKCNVDKRRTLEGMSWKQEKWPAQIYGRGHWRTVIDLREILSLPSSCEGYS